MKAIGKPAVTADEQAVLDGVRVGLIQAGEQERYDRLLVEQHYLHNAERVGEQLCYVAQYQGEWLALLSWSAPAYRLKAREAWIGWTEAQRRRRLGLVANNSCFLILKHAHYPNLASRVMRLCVGRLSADLPAKYAGVEERTAPVCEATVEELGAVRACFGRVPDWRKKIGDYIGLGAPA